MYLKLLKVVIVSFFIFTTDIVCGKKLVGEEKKILEYSEDVIKSGCDSKTSLSCSVRDEIHGGGHVRDYIQYEILNKLRGNGQGKGEAMSKGSITVNMDHDSQSKNGAAINEINIRKMSTNSIYDAALSTTSNPSQQYANQYPNTQVYSNGMSNDQDEGGGGGGGGGGSEGGGGGGGGGGSGGGGGGGGGGS